MTFRDRIISEEEFDKCVKLHTDFVIDPKTLYEKENEQVMELKIKDSASLNMIVEALIRNGYHLEISIKWKEWPQSGIYYFCVLVKEKEDL